MTDIPMARGFAYHVSVMDCHLLKVLSWRVSHELDASFCVDALEEAIETHGVPETFNTDQDGQFTSDGFTDRLERHGIHISMYGKGRGVDNVFVERFCTVWNSKRHT